MNLDFLFIFFVVTISFALYFFNFYTLKKRKKEIKEFALVKGYEYRGDGSFLKDLILFGQDPIIKEDKSITFFSSFFYGYVDLSVTDIAIFEIGNLRRITNVIIFPYRDNKIYFFDYSYMDDSKKLRTYNMTLGLYKTKKRYPEFYLRPENFFDKLVEHVGFDDIDVKGYETFSKRYYLKGRDKESVLSFFSGNKLKFFEFNLNWKIYCNGNLVALYKYDRYLRPEEYQNFIDEVFSIVKLFEE